MTGESRTNYSRRRLIVAGTADVARLIHLDIFVHILIHFFVHLCPIFVLDFLCIIVPIFHLLMVQFFVRYCYNFSFIFAAIQICASFLTRSRNFLGSLYPSSPPPSLSLSFSVSALTESRSVVARVFLVSGRVCISRIGRRERLYRHPMIRTSSQNDPDIFRMVTSTISARVEDNNSLVRL